MRILNFRLWQDGVMELLNLSQQNYVHSVRNLVFFVAMKAFFKSVNISQSYNKKSVGSILRAQCIFNYRYKLSLIVLKPQR